MNSPSMRLRAHVPAVGSAFRFVLLIGVVSLFSDMTHEGARSVTGPFLGTLGASAAAVSWVAGLGELLGYVLRSVFGYAADRSGRYWPITWVGYTLQMVAVPFLALVGNWPLAAGLIALERMGRAMRNPARDAMLAHATAELGGGRVFGVREALDAVGGMVGPLIVALVLYLHGGYRVSFAFLAVPAVLTLLVLAVAWRQYPRPGALETAPASPDTPEKLPAAFWIYLAAMGLIALGYADYPLVAYHFAQTRLFSTAMLPLLYAVAMASEAVFSLLLGRAFDRWGLLTVAVATVATAAFAPLTFLGNTWLAILGVLLWGLGMAAQESVVKATVTLMAPRTRRASAYGLFDSGFGACWFAGSVILGTLYGQSLTALVLFSAAAQLVAVVLLLVTRSRFSFQQAKAAGMPGPGQR
ncbi:MFS transporter [Streptomyces sp. NPDC047046]|uniref:MFS transporter n=1 Tax=Streptomyces sp. NPDC047046 TaxID=3155378 RepID=UPI0033F95580